MEKFTEGLQENFKCISLLQTNLTLFTRTNTTLHPVCLGEAPLHSCTHVAQRGRSPVQGHTVNVLQGRACLPPELSRAPHMLGSPRGPLSLPGRHPWGAGQHDTRPLEDSGRGQP